MKISALDKLCSEFIRKRAIKRVNGCEKCKTTKVDIVKENGDIFPAWKQLQCSHFWGRGKKSVRYDEDNAAGLCAGCHMYLTAHPALHEEWFIGYLGREKYDLLETRAMRPQKIDENLIGIYLRERIKEVL